MRSEVTPRDHLWIDVGPVKVDSTRPGAELGCLAAILAMLVVFRWAMKRI